MKTLHLNKFALLVVLTATAVAFWGLRGLYWSQVSEEPFSDLLDYLWVAKNIYEHFFWGKSAEYVAYITPVTPAVIAFSMLLGGEAHYEVVFRVLVQCVAFGSALLLASEIAKASRRPVLAVGLLVIVALCRPSIFWSYKLGTEAVSEALLLTTAGLALCTIRTGAWSLALLTGAVGLALALNRPQFFPAVFLVGLVIAASSALDQSVPGNNLRHRAVRFAGPALAFGIGAALIWGPWVVRNYILTNDLILVRTNNAEALLWESGGASIGKVPYSSLTLSDGSVVTEFGIPALRRRVEHLRTDAERDKQLKPVVDAWLRKNWREIPSLMVRRMVLFATTTGASGLTVLPRDQLFGDGHGLRGSPSTWLNFILFDKSAATSILAVLGGLIAVFILRGAGWVLGILAIVPAVFVSYVISMERAVESLISLQLWLALFAVVSFVTITLRAFRPRSIFGIQSSRAEPIKGAKAS